MKPNCRVAGQQCDAREDRPARGFDMDYRWFRLGDPGRYVPKSILQHIPHRKAVVFWYIVGGTTAVIVGFIWWRYTSVARGARQRDEKILLLIDPLGEKLAAGEKPNPLEIEALARNPAARPFLYEILKHYECLELFPRVHCSEIAQAEANLVYWMMHPNELQEAPAETVLVETVSRNIDGQDGRFHVFRYKMPAGHWAGDDWLLGLSGPYIDNDPPYSGIAGAFSRCGDKHGKIQPAELVDWFVGMVQRNRGA